MVPRLLLGLLGLDPGLAGLGRRVRRDLRLLGRRLGEPGRRLGVLLGVLPPLGGLPGVQLGLVLGVEPGGVGGRCLHRLLRGGRRLGRRVRRGLDTGGDLRPLDAVGEPRLDQHTSLYLGLTGRHLRLLGGVLGDTDLPGDLVLDRLVVGQALA
ncbi:hypothetical protein, partial [Streptomyces sp. NRRL S-481]|uniref:hypothetical protein n=1 Tax=Streptomyces sp. NRRL S-481 TaxID=1463911 RepID=UPI001F15F306